MILSKTLHKLYQFGYEDITVDVQHKGRFVQYGFLVQKCNEFVFQQRFNLYFSKMLFLIGTPTKEFILYNEWREDESYVVWKDGEDWDSGFLPITNIPYLVIEKETDEAYLFTYIFCKKQ